MHTRCPRLPNVKITKGFCPQPRLLRSLVQIATSELRRPPATTLRPEAFFTPSTCRLEEARHPPKVQIHPHSLVKMATDILPVDPQKLGRIAFTKSNKELIDDWEIEYAEGTDFESLKRAAEELVNTDVPVAFPTETVYGLGADATRSSAVKAIFAAKGRPADNPLIVHVHSLPQLRTLLRGNQDATNGHIERDPIPEIYKPLIERFWPGPITIILPAPDNSVLAPEVTAGLSTFGARMPRSILALSLLRLCGRPLAAPSANASTRPSPTAAEHVFDDLRGKIRTIIDGGPCEVGVESTVVDGLSSPPSILRPGGITVEQLRQCPGWENVVVGYKDKQEGGASKPRAPGMKYRHYSPKAEVILFEAGAGKPRFEEYQNKQKVGIIRTTSWAPALELEAERQDESTTNGYVNGTTQAPPTNTTDTSCSRQSNLLRSVIQHQVPHAHQYKLKGSEMTIWDIDLGAETEGVARGLFSALRELDKKGVDVIYVEGIDDETGDDIAVAVMNRLRKAAEIRR
ncbi:translation initiation protein Sua5 [Pyrenochaeta sp. DS3sAY3a]|nr:translation initiation protein Sua5 [Pyrenochaeta sp. DS3sAY3a]